jgi:hypothetical protein
MTLEDTATASIRVLTIELPKFSHKSKDRRDGRLYRRGGRTTYASGRSAVATARFSQASATATQCLQKVPSLPTGQSLMLGFRRKWPRFLLGIIR